MLNNFLPVTKRGTGTHYRETSHVPTLAIDFDGVIAEHRTDGNLDKTEPRRGARQALEALWDRGIRLVIWTGRDDQEDVEDWLDEHRIPYDDFNYSPDDPTESRKLVADAYIDDHNIDGREDWDSILEEALHIAAKHPQRLQRQHTILTGPSGAGKSYTSRLLSKATGMPVWKLDTDPLWSSSDGITDDPDRYTKGTKAYRKYRKLLKKLVRRALRRKKPSILEGCQFLVAPGTLRGHRIVVIDADEDTVIRQRLQRDEAEGKLQKYTRSQRVAKARQLYRHLRPLVDAIIKLPGVETITPAKVQEWVDAFARRPQKSLRKNDFSGTRPYQGAGPPQGIYSPLVHGLEDTSGEGLGGRLRHLLAAGGQAHADNWHVPILENRLRSSADRAGVPAEHLETLLLSPVYSRNAPRLLSMADSPPGLAGLVIERLSQAQEPNNGR